jgi:alpha-L-rhamnosidase
MRAVGLRCEHREDTPCIDDPAPRLSWQLESEEADQRQTGYRIVVEDDDQTLWDTGTVDSSASVDVAYGGRPLPSGSLCTWRVQVRDRDGRLSDWSDPASFRVGLASWTACWIRRDRRYDPGVPVPGDGGELELDDTMLGQLPACPYFRRRFELRTDVARATLYATARGVLSLELNGAIVGDDVLSPGWTDYRARIEYAAHDVTKLLHPGANVLIAVVGDGWYAGMVGFDARRRGNHYGREPELLCELHLDYADGTREVIASDGQWEATTGPVLYSDLQMGVSPGHGAPCGRARATASGWFRSAHSRCVGPRSFVRSRRSDAGRGRTSSTSGRTWSAGCGWLCAGRAARACRCASRRCSSPTARCT